MLVKFFNTRIAGHIGVAKLYRFTRATVISFAIRWDARNNIKLEIEEPMAINPDVTDQEIIDTAYKPFEKALTDSPKQWIQIENYEAFMLY